MFLCLCAFLFLISCDMECYNCTAEWSITTSEPMDGYPQYGSDDGFRCCGCTEEENKEWVQDHTYNNCDMVDGVEICESHYAYCELATR